MSAIKNVTPTDPTVMCPVCQDDIGTDPALTHEGGELHLFHEHCLRTWLTAHTTCPSCRATIIGPSVPDPLEYPAEAVRMAAPDPLIQASGRGEIETVRELLLAGEIEEESRGFSVWLAAKRGHTQIVRELLENGPITDGARGNAVGLAARRGDEETLQILLANGPISTNHRGLALQKAVRNLHGHIVPILLENGPINMLIQEEAAMNALRNHRIPIVLNLIQNGNISEASRRLLVEFCLERDQNIELVREVLRTGPVPENSRDRILLRAAQNGHILTNELYPNTSIIWREIVTAACRNGHLRVVENFLLPIGDLGLICLMITPTLIGFILNQRIN